MTLLVLPPLRLRPAEEALERTRTQLSAVLHGLAVAISDDRPPEDVIGHRWRDRLSVSLRDSWRAVDEAHESRRWNPRGEARRAVWHLDTAVPATFQRLADDAEQITHAVRGCVGQDPAAPAAGVPGEEFRAGYARLLDGAAVCVRDWRGGRPHPLLPATRRSWRKLAEPAADGSGGPFDLDVRAAEGRLLMLLDRTLSDLDRAHHMTGAGRAGR